MNKKHLAIIVVAVLLVLAVAASIYVLTSQPHYKNITMNGITMEVPESNISVIQQTEHFSIYNDTEKSVNILVYDSTNIGLNDLAEAVTFAAVRDTFQVGATQQTSDNLTYNYSQTHKVYTYVGNYSHKNLFIVTKEKEDMIHALKTINVDMDVNISLNESNQTNQSVSSPQTTKTSTPKNESVEREDEKVIDGWDPKEHEVSRERLDDDREKVYYDDGYFRLVDNDGKVESYGYGY